MKSRTAALAGAVGAVLLGGIAGVVYVRVTGLKAAPQPLAFEAAVARQVRRLAISGDDARRTNPVAFTPGVLTDALAHYADHCASCHGNDGSGNTELGRGLFPKAPDMRLPATQQLTDGELFFIIEHGIRFTGMPAWSTGTAAGETASWQLVYAIRHLPRLTAAEMSRMQELTPRSPDAIRQEIEEETFLTGGDVPSPSTPAH
jgi:mono/diheme cytochrome c family protein